MAVIRITRKQIEEANKAREAALLEDHDFHLHDERLQCAGREAAVAHVKAAARAKEQPS